ncbi:hypothetical protein BDQ17DRAFT_1432463 [Cyathus striatus]|nr:hypothetical protein BDQ17DRAFT_1432463 [Cyathus striatus]
MIEQCPSSAGPQSDDPQFEQDSQSTNIESQVVSGVPGREVQSTRGSRKTRGTSTQARQSGPQVPHSTETLFAPEDGGRAPSGAATHQSSGPTFVRKLEWDNIIKGHPINLSVISAAISAPNKVGDLDVGSTTSTSTPKQITTEGKESLQPMEEISEASLPTLMIPLTSLHLTKHVESMLPVSATSSSVISKTSGRSNSHTSHALENISTLETTEHNQHQRETEHKINLEKSAKNLIPPLDAGIEETNAIICTNVSSVTSWGMAWHPVELESLASDRVFRLHPSYL